MRFEFTLKGRTALLMHADNIEWADYLDAWRKDPRNKNLSRAGDDRSPAWTWTGYCHHDGANVAVPDDMIRKCLSLAGAKVILKGRTTMKELAVSGLWIEQEYLTFTNRGQSVPVALLSGLREVNDYAEHLVNVRAAGFDLFARRARIGTSKHVRVRPKFDAWMVRGSIEIVNPDIKPVTLEQLLTIAGRLGLGDWRPSSPTPGRYGMFTSELQRID